jgi:hypothetical protein
VFRKHLRKRCAEVNVALAVLCFEIGLNDAPLRFLANLERAAIFRDVFAELQAERLASAEWTATREKRIEHTILPCRFL